MLVQGLDKKKKKVSSRILSHNNVNLIIEISIWYIVENIYMIGKITNIIGVELKVVRNKITRQGGNDDWSNFFNLLPYCNLIKL